ncbi:acyl-CoA synthetase (AMP-forming)/AMP-acid ligase II [Mycobacterium sp. JS623]|uniref:fatty acyl-AMP ligase n=1 Tax=Mycobacterium sp. JS623 TaxID=212767 RepID=UPI0002A579C6|nr:fatty acyl-AMP ligase [Mycobacterium sp. JS623]AGB25924.1 acyl-CoA synthetase (AMP-forming)/AMP-acid ligase II [Mycobacterium sp. JS623]
MAGLLQIEECLDADGGVEVPPGVTLISLIERNIANVGDSVAYRYLDFTRSEAGQPTEITWMRFGHRLEAIGARIQQIAGRDDRVAILAPQGLEYVAAFYAAIKAGTIAVPLFAPELPGHAERLETALNDSQPALVLTTSAVRDAVDGFLTTVSPCARPHVIAVDEIPDSAAEVFRPVEIDLADVSHLQYTGGATRPPVGVEVTHRAVGTNLIQMILSIDLLDRNTHGVSWLPLYHDMGLSMIGFPAVYGGHSTLMTPTAFIRRPQRWIHALSAGSREGRVITAAPNFAYEWAAQRGVPDAADDIDLSNVALIIGSEPVSMDAIRAFDKAFAPFGLPRSAVKPSYGIADATLLVSTIEPGAEPTVKYFDRKQLARDSAVATTADDPNAVAHVSCGQVARSLSAVIVDPDAAEELSDGHVGEIWLQGDNVCRGYWGRPDETRHTFGAKLRSRQGDWLRTGDFGVYSDGELYVIGRIADRITIDGLHHYPEDIEATTAEASPMVRRGYVVAFTDDGQRLVIIAERAAGTARDDPTPAIEAIRKLVSQKHGLTASEVHFVRAGAIPRTTSGKLARWASRERYLSAS